MRKMHLSLLWHCVGHHRVHLMDLCTYVVGEENGASEHKEQGKCGKINVWVFGWETFVEKERSLTTCELAMYLGSDSSQARGVVTLLSV